MAFYAWLCVHCCKRAAAQGGCVHNRGCSVLRPHFQGSCSSPTYLAWTAAHTHTHTHTCKYTKQHGHSRGAGDECVLAKGRRMRRRTEVRFACSPDGHTYMLVREPDYCTYVVVVYAQALCALPELSPRPAAQQRAPQ